MIGDFTSTVPFTVPEIVPMVKGVLKSFPNVTIETCDGKGTAPAFLICEQRRVRRRSPPVVLGFVRRRPGHERADKANIPVIGNGDAHSPNMYPTLRVVLDHTSTLGAGLAETGLQEARHLYLDGADFLVDNIKPGFEVKGGKEVARASVAANAADLAPAVAKVTGAGAECVAVSLTPYRRGPGSDRAQAERQDAHHRWYLGGLQRSS